MGYYLLFSLAFFMPASFAPYQKKSLASFASPFSKLFQLQNRMHSFWIEGVLYSHVGNWIIPFWPLFWWKMGHFSRCSRCASGASKAPERYFAIQSLSEVVWIKDGGFPLYVWGPPAFLSSKGLWADREMGVGTKMTSTTANPLEVVMLM